MLTHLNETSHSIFAKLLLGVLVISFGFWGIGDMLHQGGRASDVATVGGTSISLQEYRHVLREREESLRQRLGNKYNPELMRRFGLDRMVRDQMILDLLVEKETQSLGLTAGDDSVVSAIQANQAFKDDKGHFSKAYYLEWLKSQNMSESRYVADLRKEMGASVLNATLASGSIVPEELVRALYKVREEQRTADLYIIPASAVKQVPAPTDKEIKAYYDAHDRIFATPEYRTVSYIVLKEGDAQAGITVPEADIKHVYEERVQDFHTPERRTVDQLLFDNEAAAKEAAARLSKGERFSDVAKDKAVVNKGKIALGTFSKPEAPAFMADDVFTLKENAASPPIHSEFGWHIFRVTKIVPESTRPLADVKAEITRDLAAKEAQGSMMKRVDELEDTLAGGATLESTAQKLGLKVEKIGPVTHDGTTPQGKKAMLPAYGSFLNTAFSTGEKDHSQAVQAGDGSYYMLQVDEVRPEHVRPLTEVKNQVLTNLNEEKKQAMLQSLSESVAADLRAGKKPEAVFASHAISISPQASGKLKRSSDKTAAKLVLPEGLVEELFRLSKPHDSTHAYGLPDGGGMIAVLTQVFPAPPVENNSAALYPIRNELKETMTKEMLDDYLVYLSKKYHVSRNDAALGTRDEGASE